jgi:hypothetical protein
MFYLLAQYDGSSIIDAGSLRNARCLSQVGTLCPPTGRLLNEHSPGTVKSLYVFVASNAE